MPIKSTSHPINQSTVIIDATDQVLGRLAVRVANIIRGKDKPTYQPNDASVGGKVLVVNADKIKVTGRKAEQKIYFRHTGWPGGLRKKSLGERLKIEPDQIIYDAVKGMLPKNRLQKEWLKRLTVMRGTPDSESRVASHDSPEDQEVS